MTSSATACTRLLSTAPPGVWLALAALSAVSPGCGWHLGPPPVASGAVSVSGVALEPGLRSALEAAVARVAAERGAGPVVVALTGYEERAVAGAPYAWSTRLAVRAGRPDSPGCGGAWTAERAWVAPSAEAVDAARAAAAGSLADEIARRAVGSVEGACP